MTRTPREHTEARSPGPRSRRSRLQPPPPPPDVHHGSDPLALTALLLLTDGTSSADLVARFAEVGAVVSAERASELIERLRVLGLLRSGGDLERDPRYVVTSLGRRLVETFAAGWPDVIAGLEELERLRSDLFATIAHELRTPLTAIRTSIGLLLAQDVRLAPGDREQLLQTVSRNAERMQGLVRDVLDLARFRAGAVELQLRRFDARALARGVAAAINPLAEARAQHMELSIPPAAVWVYGDHRRLEQALTNLVSNAEKFSPDGGTFHLSVERRDEDVCWVVVDHGPGIEADEMPRLFERFFVGQGDRSGPGGGVGLGLPTALAVAQAHGGVIEVDSEPGRGSTFTLRVPAAGPPFHDGA